MFTKFGRRRIHYHRNRRDSLYKIFAIYDIHRGHVGIDCKCGKTSEWEWVQDRVTQCR